MEGMKGCCHVYVLARGVHLSSHLCELTFISRQCDHPGRYEIATLARTGFTEGTRVGDRGEGPIGQLQN